MKKYMLMACVVTLGWMAEAIPLPEHPRPDWERSAWVNLNGEWNFVKDKDNKGLAERWFTKSAQAFPLKIQVPFPWGSPASGIKEEGVNVAWYQREVTIPKAWKGKRIYLIVGASDRVTKGWMNGRFIGENVGGYVPFEFELTHRIDWEKSQQLVLRVENNNSQRHLHGKQGYGDVKGIWQTVYLEARDEKYLKTVHFYPNIKDGTVTAKATLNGPAKKPLTFSVAFKPEHKATPASVTFQPGQQRAELKIALKDVKLWEIENPYLYEVKAQLKGENVNDDVATYFGMREISVARLPGSKHPYVALNGKPVYLKMALDQSYTPMGHYTFPSDEYMKNEIMISKVLGLNGNRIHIKVEVPRKLYWADKLGLLIMADVPNAWGSPSPEWFADHRDCTRRMIERDFNHPSIFSWVLWNETWGLYSCDAATGEREYFPQTQEYVAERYWETKTQDPTRLVEDNSTNLGGGHVISDLYTWHEYCDGHYWEHSVREWCKTTFPGSQKYYEKGYAQGDTPMLNSECGNVWGYSGSTGDCDYTRDYHMMMNALRRNMKCSGWVYTEHHDVVNEWNGYVRFDRTWKETGIEELFPGMSLKDLHADAYLPLDEKIYREFKAGESWNMPVDISLATDKYAGKKVALSYRVRYWDQKGHLTEGTDIAAGEFPVTAWQYGRLTNLSIKLPNETASGVICFTLKTGSETIARNFVCFVTRGDSPRNVVSVDVTNTVQAAWSQKAWVVLDGKKMNGTGKGSFSYAFKLPTDKKGDAVFRAEVSSKRLYKKDIDDKDKKDTSIDLDYMLGGGLAERSANPNSYPQTSVYKFPATLKVYANGVLIKEMTLPDDPADHRGFISWGHQPGGRLRDAGSYGYLVEAKIPSDVLAKSENGKVVIKLESDHGLALYGALFGRYAFDPSIWF